MDRLTKRYNNGTATLDAKQYNMAQEAVDIAIRNCEPIAAAVKRLAEYEDSKKQYLSYKSGDVVWVVECEDELDVAGYIFMAECMGYAILVAKYAHCINFRQQVIEMSANAVCGDFEEMIVASMENIFHTREEAERALKELQA